MMPDSIHQRSRLLVAMFLLLLGRFVLATTDHSPCNQLQKGKKQILAMGATEDVFVVVANDYTAYTVPLSQFASPTAAAGTPSLDLSGARPIQLNGSQSLGKPSDSKFAFLYKAGDDWGKKSPWKGGQHYVVLVWPDLKSITALPLNGAEEAVEQKLASPDPLKPVQAAFSHPSALLLQEKGHLGIYILFVNTDSSGTSISIAYTNKQLCSWTSTVDGGWTWQAEGIVFGFSNQNATVSYKANLTDEATVDVAYSQFFVCSDKPSTAGTPSKDPEGSNKKLIIAIIVSAIVLVVLAVFGFILLPKRNKVQKKLKKSPSGTRTSKISSPTTNQRISSVGANSIRTSSNTRMSSATVNTSTTATRV